MLVIIILTYIIVAPRRASVNKKTHFYAIHGKVRKISSFRLFCVVIKLKLTC
jgi:hypothetical protein